MGRNDHPRNHHQTLTIATLAFSSMMLTAIAPELAKATENAPQATRQHSVAQEIGQNTIAQNTAQEAYPTLTANSTGDSVSRLQATLKLLGFYQGAVNGTYTQATQEAVARFQAAAGIAADGVAGPSTWKKLLPTPGEVTNTAIATAPIQPRTLPAPANPTANPPATPPTNAPANPPAEVPSGPPLLRPDAEGPAVAQLQRELRDLNYYDGEIDGGYGEQTQAAVMAFQRDQQLEVDAIVGNSTWDALTRALER